jgi:hypothetical protein
LFFATTLVKFPDLIHAAKPEPDREFPQAQTAHDTFWDFISLTPESFHMVMWIMSDRAIPRSYRMMEGFGVHTFRLVDAKDKATFRLQEIQLQELLDRRRRERLALLDRQRRQAVAGLGCDDDARASFGDDAAEHFEQYGGAVEIYLQDRFDGRLRGRHAGGVNEPLNASEPGRIFRELFHCVA